MGSLNRGRSLFSLAEQLFYQNGANLNKQFHSKYSTQLVKAPSTSHSLVSSMISFVLGNYPNFISSFYFLFSFFIYIL